MTQTITVTLYIMLLWSLTHQPADAEIVRSRAQVNAFKRLNPCPANGKRSGPCGGYVVDHIMPLACKGADRPINMQWQTIKDGKAKDRWEIRGDKKHKPCSGDKQ